MSSKSEEYFAGKEMSENYAKYRPAVQNVVLDKIICEYFKDNSVNDLKTIVDVGCGPGDNTDLVKLNSLTN